ncbi:uncharacterized protein LACBIDRAFT_329378 [Laccaria bicolor S238N-H82]|uniref:Predicted protein n=1 Tax=Laccaria bicolor (strain S238N-H82 / ATCC MYA-4686) TaxID=486041 RepID=B0DHU9_LACBS|nr:uncharacterized protein LACBIDRAFT_329378 [Laccaria bicolor S238N-H82]EDR05896.1 predicted protein [Laccaria bicolor S238N-H82]|eukprot:XP_001883572.1 predicted protein [Laccaria bicolor S238N-H82]
MYLELEDAPLAHLKAMDSNTVTLLSVALSFDNGFPESLTYLRVDLRFSRKPIDPRIQVFPGDLLQLSPSSSLDDSRSEDVLGLNGESADSGSWSLESTPSLLISDLSPVSTLADISPPCTPNIFDTLGELTMSNTSIPLPDCRDVQTDRDQAAPSSPALPPLLLMSPECSQVSLDPASITSLLFSSNNPDAEVYVQNDIQDGYQAPQPASVDDYPPSRGPPPLGQDDRAHTSPRASQTCFPPPEAPLDPRSASAFKSGWNDIQPGMDEVDATQYHSAYSLHQSFNEVKWNGGCFPSITSLKSRGNPSYPVMRRLPVGSLVPTSSISSTDDATTSSLYEQRCRTNNLIYYRHSGRFVVPSAIYLGDAGTCRKGGVQRCQADFTHSPSPSLPSLPLGDSGRQPSKKVTRTARERASSKMTSRTSRKAVPSKTMPQAPREDISSRSSGKTNSLLATSPSLPAHNLKGNEHESGDIDVDSGLPNFHPIGSPNIYAASKLRRKHEAKYRCTMFEGLCKATFTSEHNLNNHIECHLGLLSYCSGCEKAFKHSSSKDRHEKRSLHFAFVSLSCLYFYASPPVQPSMIRLLPCPHREQISLVRHWFELQARRAGHPGAQYHKLHSSKLYMAIRALEIGIQTNLANLCSPNL